MTDILFLLFMLLAGHFLADYPLQGEFLANGKNRHTELGKVFWKHALPAHAMIHGGMVALLTSNVYLGIAEAIIHGVTDFLKCEGKITLNQDQFVHILCKVVWVIILMNV